MAPERICLGAWTASSGYAYYPKYVNVTLVLDDLGARVEFTVRGPEDLGSREAVCGVPVDDFAALCQEMADRLHERFNGGDDASE
jgi:hypothetical protein